MKASKILAILCALLCVVMSATACKSEEQLEQAQGNEPTVISPDVNITQETGQPTNVLNVSGSGKVILAPDTATFYIQIYTEAKEPATAQNDNAAKTEAVTAAVIAAGVDEKNIQTYNVDLSEIYDYDKSPYTITGYQMTTTLFVTVTPIDSAGTVIGDAIAAGATGTSGLTFTVSDTSDAYEQALQTAIADASGKAKAMAEALGVELRAVPVSVTENSQSTPVVYDAASEERNTASTDDAAVEMPISTGEITVTATVGVVYEMIDPAA